MRAETRAYGAAAASLCVLLTVARRRRRLPACEAQLMRTALLAALSLAACSDRRPSRRRSWARRDRPSTMRGADWPSYNRDLAGTRFSPLRADLRRRTSTSCGRRGRIRSALRGTAFGGSELTPLVVGGVLYATAADRVVALRADSGAELWRFPLDRRARRRSAASAFWPGDAATAARIFFTAGRTLVALDAATGQKVRRVRPRRRGGDADALQRRADAFEDLLIVGSNGPPGGVRAYDARSGEGALERSWARRRCCIRRSR